MIVSSSMRASLSLSVVVSVVTTAAGAGAAESDKTRWDEAVAMAVTRAMNGPVVPGILVAEHKPNRGWTVKLRSTNRRILHCSQAGVGKLTCKERGIGNQGKRADGATSIDGLGTAVAAFVHTLRVPSSRYVRLETVALRRSVVLLLRQAETNPTPRGMCCQTKQVSTRIVAPWGDDGSTWRVTQPLPPRRVGLGDHGVRSTVPIADERIEASVEPIAVPGGVLVVLSTADEGNGNNAVGTLFYRGVTVVPSNNNAVMRVVASIELGKGSWARYFDDSAFRVSSTAALLCPSAATGGFVLTEACPNSVDPRRSETFAMWCSRPCKRKKKIAGRAGRYFVRNGQLHRARAKSVRPVRKGDLFITEVPEATSSGQIEYIEVRNKAHAAIILNGVEIVNIDEEGAVSELSIVLEEPLCIADAGEVVLLTESDNTRRDLTASAVVCPTNTRGSLDLEAAIELRAAEVPGTPGGAVLARCSARKPPNPRPTATEASRRAWQVDAYGRSCWQEASPGRKNQSCR